MVADQDVDVPELRDGGVEYTPWGVRLGEVGMGIGDSRPRDGSPR
ncbi:hypothetical protein [Streptomyces iconiensis]